MEYTVTLLINGEPAYVTVEGDGISLTDATMHLSDDIVSASGL